MIESSTKIIFYAATYTYPEFFLHMKQAGMSIWTNKWTDVYDFTPNKKADDGSPNFTISSATKHNFVPSFEEMKKKFDNLK